MNGTPTTITKRTFASLMMLILGLSAMLIGFASTAGSASAAEGDEECVPSAGTAAVFSDWAPSGFTAWQTSSTVPGDPDGQSGETNELNLQMLGAMQQQTVTDQAESTEQVFDHWQRYSWNGANQSQNTPPAATPPHRDWQANAPGDPHGVGKAGLYWRPAGQSESGGGWFYLEAVTKTVHHDAVTHEEYRWTVLSRTVRTPATGPVVCDDPTDPTTDPTDPTTDPTDPTEPEECPEGTNNVGKEIPEGVDPNVWCAEVGGIDATPPGGDNPGGDNPGGGNPGGDNPRGPEVKGDDGVQPTVLGIEAQAPGAVAPAAAAPTAVDAGLTGGTEAHNSSTLWVLAGGALVLAGLVLGFGPAPARGKRAL